MRVYLISSSPQSVRPEKPAISRVWGKPARSLSQTDTKAQTSVRAALSLAQQDLAPGNTYFSRLPHLHRPKGQHHAAQAG